jgi:hypothetical protein
MSREMAMVAPQQVSLKYKSDAGAVCWRNFVGQSVDRGESWEVYLRADDGTIVFYDKSSLKIFDLAAADELVAYLDGPVVDRVKRELTYLEREDAEAPLNKF